jgi:hypothetical protein
VKFHINVDKITDPAFFYMVLGQYPVRGANQLISREWISRARARWASYTSENGEKPSAYAQAVMGLDVGELGQDANAACFRYGGYVERLKTWGGVDPTVTADIAVKVYQEKSARVCNVDATGVGSSVAPSMSRAGCSAIGVKVAASPTVKTEAAEFTLLRDQLWFACREWLRTDPGAMLPPDEELIQELSIPTYEIHKGKIRVTKKDVMREILKRSPDKADSLCLTFYQGGIFTECDLS